MPKTSYIKMIDVWLLFGLVLPFLGFLLSIFEELVAQLQEDADMGRTKVRQEFCSDFLFQSNDQVDGSVTKVSPVSPLPYTERQGRLEKTGDLLRLLGRKVLPMATIAFVLVYWAVASVAYFTPSLQFGA